ncbi:MAG: GldG family protein [Bdellovibrionales bacterium]|nr:GldG family protein [Bdellovibrionales bacterium]
MSKIGIGLFFLAALALATGGVMRLIFNQWEPSLWIPLISSGVFLAVGVLKEWVTIRDFFSLRTTRHGANMGTVILIAIIGLGAVNFISYKKNKKWDLTEEKINSLSEQSTKILAGLSDEVQILGFFAQNAQGAEQARAQFDQITKLFSDESSQVKVQIYDPLKRPDLQKEYGVEMNGTVVLKYKDKKTTIQEVSEEALTNALIKVSREANKVIYFMTGHGEMDLENSEKPEGAGQFKKSLQEASYDVKSFKFVETGKIPEGAAVIAIVGPKQPLLQPEMDALLAFAANGGALLLAMDPGMKHNLGDLAKKLGVEFRNNFIIDQVGNLLGVGAAVAIGIQYSPNSDITKNFGQDMTGFRLASSLRKIEGMDTLRFDEIVKSTPQSFSKKELSDKVKFVEGTDERGPLTIAMAVSGNLPESSFPTSIKIPAGQAKEFNALIIGDSDFLGNGGLTFQLNRDLALNSLSHLAKDKDLISIRPKELKGTQLVITRTQTILLFLGLGLVPLVFFTTSGVMWYRRRSA